MGDRGPRPPSPLEKSQNIGFLSNIGPDLLKNHKATKPDFNVRPPSARQRNAISMALHWRAYDGPLIVLFGLSLPASTRKVVKFGPLCLGPAQIGFLMTVQTIVQCSSQYMAN